MDLGLRLPNVWYRLSLVYLDASRNRRRVTGVTLPGTPAIIVGSNGRVAWGLTNSAGSYLDLVGLDADTMESLRYQVADGGSEQAVRQVERIGVKGAPTDEFPIIETRWGHAIQGAQKTYAEQLTATHPHALTIT